MHGPDEFRALVVWYLAAGLALIFYVALGQPPLRTRALAVAVGVLLTVLAVYALLDVPFVSGINRFLVIVTFAGIPPCSFGIGWLLFRRSSR